jgi:hypothetical protein
VIVAGNRFEMQADVEPAGSDIEFVTSRPAFDTTPPEREALQETMTEMTALCKRIEGLSKKYRNKMFSAQYLGGNANILINPGPIPIMGAAQVTGGLTLERLPALMKDLGYDRTSGAGRSKGSELLMGLGGENEAQIIHDATRAAETACDSLRQKNPERGGGALQGLLALIFSYLLMGDRAEGVMSYAKHIAPIMSRTNLGSLFLSLPEPDRFPFQHNRIAWVRFVLDAAGMSGTSESPIYKLGFKMDDKVPATISHGPARGYWLREIAEGVDVMTDPRGVRKEEAVYEGMGKLGRKTEPVGPEMPIPGVQGAMGRRGGAIFELRRIQKNIVYENWPAFTESIFEYFEKLGDPSVQTPQYTGQNIWGRSRAQK